MSKLLQKIEIADILIFVGLSEAGAGLFLWFGLDVALTVIGAIIFCIGFFGGAVKVKR